MNGLGNSSFLSKELGPVTVGQIIAIIASMAIGLVLINIAVSVLMCMIIAAILYMFPHMFGATPKVKITYGVIFAVILVLFGAFSAGPACVDNHSSSSVTEHNGISIEYHADSTGLTADVDYDGPNDPSDLKFIVNEVNNIAFGYFTVNTDHMTFNKDSHIDLDRSKLYQVYAAFLDSEGNIDNSTASYATLTGFAYDGNVRDYTLDGAIKAVAYEVVLFFIIVTLTWVIRNRAAAARTKMEAAGRLYPQGYGRCTFCGSIVLPGEVRCRKCDAYIDRPEYMKAHKKDFLTCSECGAEITEDMTECPKCGAKFDGHENVVTHVDGTQEVGEETKTCPDCGAVLPVASELCPKCGKRF